MEAPTATTGNWQGTFLNGLAGKSLVEVAAIIEARATANGADAIVVGGSAITCHVPEIYTSLDIDFAVVSQTRRGELVNALLSLGFARQGRGFAHPDTPFTVDIVSEAPAIGDRFLREFATVESAAGPVRVLKIEDAIADRIAAFLYWSDSESLHVAERAAAGATTRIDHAALHRAIDSLAAPDPATQARRSLAVRRVSAALGHSDDS